LQLFLVHPRNLAGTWKAGNLEALVNFKFDRYQAVLRFIEVPPSKCGPRSPWKSWNQYRL